MAKWPFIIIIACAFGQIDFLINDHTGANPCTEWFIQGKAERNSMSLNIDISYKL